MKRLTIFTPTYNRAHLLPKLYESLKKQTCKDFVWLIVDDGSTDDTKKLIDKFKKDNIIKISYHYKENGGKNTAMDYSNQVCKTDYIACVDSDDYLTEDSVEKTIKLLPMCDENENCVGIVARRFKSNGEPFQSTWTKENIFIYFYELSEKYGYSSDTYLIFKTNIIKKFSFPKIDGERFITETVFYNQFLYDYMMLTCEDNLYIGEYMEDGYTASGMDLFFKNPKGFYYALKSYAYTSIKYKQKLKLRVYYMAYMYSWAKIFSFKQLFKNEFKFSLFYKLCGKLAMVLLYPKINKSYKVFKKKNDKNR